MTTLASLGIIPTSVSAHHADGTDFQVNFSFALESALP